MGFKIASSEVKVCHTMQEAVREALALNAYGQLANERPLKPRHQLRIESAIAQGYALIMDWAIGRVPSLDLTRRVNGDHSSHAVIALGERSAEEQAQVPMPIYICYTVYECETPEELSFLYSQFDQSMSVRTFEDQLQAYMGNRPELLPITTAHSNRYATGGLMWYLQKAEGYQGRSARDRCGLILENSDVQRFLEFCGPTGLDLTQKKREINQTAVTAAMYHTTRWGTEADQGFWRRVSGGRASFSRYEEDSHAAKLALFLEQTMTEDHEWGALKNRFRNKQVPNREEIFGICLRVFGMWKKDTPMGEVVVSMRDQDVPEMIRRFYPLPAAA
jgi:hypothetical protein